MDIHYAIQSKEIRISNGKEEIKMNKSLLALLQKEYSLVRNIYVNEEIYETYRNEDKHRASEFMKKSEESKKALLECQKEISQYLVFLEGLKETKLHFKGRLEETIYVRI